MSHRAMRWLLNHQLSRLCRGAPIEIAMAILCQVSGVFRGLFNMREYTYYTTIDYTLYSIAAVVVITIIGTALFLMFTRN